MGSHPLRDQAFVHKLIAIIEARMGNEQFGVQELADEIGLSRPHLHRKVSSILGKSTSSLIREYRLGVALELLKEDLLTVSEIAYKVGFSSPTYFNTCFHNQFGYPPGEAKFRATRIPSSVQGPVRVPVSNRRNLLNITLLALVVIASLFAGFFIYSYVYEPSPYRVGKEQENPAYQNTIAVLPFRNWSEDTRLDILCDGMTNAISAMLSEVRAFSKVVPFTSVLKYKETALGATEIAGQLKVGLITQGDIQLASDEILVIVQLIDVSSDDILWTEEFSSPWQDENAVEIQQSISLKVVRSIQEYIEHRQFQGSAVKIPSKTGKLQF